MKKFVLKARDGFIKKFVPVSMAVGTACSALAVSVSAAEGESGSSSTVDISSVTTSLTSNLVDLATKAGVACAAVVGAGLTIFGIKWVVKKIMGFFKVIGN